MRHENEVGFSVYDAVMSQMPPTGESVSVAAQWRLTGGSIQAIDCYLVTDLPEFSSSKLSKIDWEILEGLDVTHGLWYVSDCLLWRL